MSSQSSPARASEHAVSRDKRGRWEKGASPNAGGRPKKDRALTAALEMELDRKVKGKTRRQLVAEKVVDLAVTGDMMAAKFLADRTEGLPIQRHRFDHEDLRQQAEALAEENGLPVEQVEPMLKRHLTLVQ